MRQFSFLKKLKKMCVLKKCEFFGGRGFPLAALEGGSTLRE
jgi:hypothetical protein